MNRHVNYLIYKIEIVRTCVNVLVRLQLKKGQTSMSQIWHAYALKPRRYILERLEFPKSVPWV
jgi:hypothetical protein